MPDDPGAFDDSDQLTQTLHDAKATDALAVSTVADALVAVEAFAQEQAASPWTSLDRAAVADRLGQLLRDPRQLQQGALNLCGPAAFLSQWAKRHPVAFANYAIGLFDTGVGQIGSLTVAPSNELMNCDYSAMVQKMGSHVSPAADWCVLGALRNSTEAFWQGTWVGDPNQMVAAMTQPEQLTSWFNSSGIYRTVENQANWMTCAGVPHAVNLNLFAGTDISLLIHANLINLAVGSPVDTNWLLTQFPNHYVALLGPILPDLKTADILLTIWSWGGVLDLRVPQQAFIDNYYGAVIAKLPLS